MNNKTFRQSMGVLHTWSGLVLGWVLYFVFITGTVGYFDLEIDRWMQPEIPFAHEHVIEQRQLLDMANKQLEFVAQDAATWYAVFPAGRYPFLTIWWRGYSDKATGRKGKWEKMHLHPATGEQLKVRDTGGGQQLYRMHYTLHYIPSVLGHWITSLAAMFMLIALVTGIVIHKRIIKDFFTFRPGKHQRSWLDMHNVLSILPLPFHLMITYSGLMLLMFTTMSTVISASYGTERVDHQRFLDEAAISEKHLHASGQAAHNVDIVDVFDIAEQQWGKGQIQYIGIDNRGDKNAFFELEKVAYTGITHREQQIYNANGQRQQPEEIEQHSIGYATQFYQIMLGLHEGEFANAVLRWLYFLSGLLATGMIATGLVLWVVKRDRQQSENNHASLRLIAQINIGMIVGLPVAIAAYFWANRLIAIDIDARSQWEVHVLFIIWGLMLVYPFFLSRWRCLRDIWQQQLMIAALAYLLLPLINLVTTEQHLGTTIRQGDWAMAGVDLSMLLIGASFLFAVYKLRSKVNDE